MKILFLLIPVSLLFACNSEAIKSDSNSNGSSTAVAEKVVDTTKKTMEQIYTEKLAKPCNCNIVTNFELSGEGESSPLVVNIEGKDKEYFVMSARVSGWDGKEYFFVDSLEDGTKFSGNKAKVLEQGPLKNTWLKGGPVYAWPDENSEQVFNLKSDSNWTWDRCFGDWVRVRQWDDNTNEYKYGWVKKP